MGWGGSSGRGTHVHPWLIHVNVWQKPLQYCKIISLQLLLLFFFLQKLAGKGKYIDKYIGLYYQSVVHKLLQLLYRSKDTKV